MSKKTLNIEVLGYFFIRSKTNNGDLSKQYCKVLKDNGMNDALIIRKLILSEDVNLYADNLQIIKKFKDKYLFEQKFGLKLSTLSCINTTLNDIMKLT